MQCLLFTVLLLSLTVFELGNGEESVSDVSMTKKDQEIDDLASLEDDDQLDDNAQDRWLAPELYDEIEKRSKGKNQNKNKNKNKNKTTPAPTGRPGEEGQEELPTKKNKGGSNKNNTSKNNPKNRPAKNRFSEKGKIACHNK